MSKQQANLGDSSGIETYAYLRLPTTVETASNLEVPASPAVGGGWCWMGEVEAGLEWAFCCCWCW